MNRRPMKERRDNLIKGMAEKLFYTMGEVSEMFDVNQSLIRHWEKEFSVLRPKRNKKGNRLFSPQDVERLKLIYHLVKERGMTLEGARKALRQHRDDDKVPRDVELTERLQRIRSLLLEVREELKEGPAGVYTAGEAESGPAAESNPKAVPEKPVPAEKSEPVERVSAETAPTEEIPEVPQADEPEQAVPETEPVQSASRPGRKPRRKKDDDDNNELFAYYEQSLF